LGKESSIEGEVAFFMCYQTSCLNESLVFSAFFSQPCPYDFCRRVKQSPKLTRLKPCHWETCHYQERVRKTQGHENLPVPIACQYFQPWNPAHVALQARSKVKDEVPLMWNKWIIFSFKLLQNEMLP